MTTVLDASALLALMLREPGWEKVADALGNCVIGTVNVSEIVAKLSERGLGGEAVSDAISRLGVTVIDFDLPQALAAGALRPVTRALGLSLGDRACLALASVRGDPVLTANRAWSDVDIGVEIGLVC